MDDSSRKNENEYTIIDNSPLIRVYKRGKVVYTHTIPPSLDPKTGVKSKDISISSTTGVCVRLFKPPNNLQNNLNYQNHKIPVLLYIHGGGFHLESTFSATYHNYLNGLAYEAQVMVVSVEYRKAPEHRLPAAYHDCWNALIWVVSNKNNNSNREPWLEEEHVDLSRIYLMGDSAGGNIVHYLALRVGIEESEFCISGIILVHPYFWGEKRIGDEGSKLDYLSISGVADKVWDLARPSASFGADHPWINPGNDPRLLRLGCKRVLVFVAQKDFFRDRGVYYKEELERSGWQGTVEVVESKGEDHVFHLLNPYSVNSADIMRKIVAFLHPVNCKL